MALRINTNVPAMEGLFNLQRTDQNLSKSLQRLSTGLRINTASDDPSGLVISEQLRAQVTSMKQALRNSQDASNMIGTTEAALDEVSSLLIQIRESVVFALNTGGNSAEQIAAEQDSVDNILQSIDRIAETTSWGTRKLLDGSAGIKVASSVGSGITDYNIQSVQFDGNSQLNFSLSITNVASRAGGVFGGVTGAFAGASNGTVIRLTGNLGTEDIALGSTFTATSFDDAINAFSVNTGIFASAGLLYSVDYGTDATISLQVISGSIDLGAALTSTNSVQSDAGSDAEGYVNGAAFSAKGNQVRIVSGFLTADFTLAEGTDATSDTAFTVKDSGLVFQLNDGAPLADRERIGIRSVDSSMLGTSTFSVPGLGGNALTYGGYLSTLMSGSTNDLSSDPQNALRIVDAAQKNVSDMRAYLGAFKAQTLDTNANSLSVAIENLAASESTIRDLDFAAETTEFTRNQIMYQSGIAVLAQANLISQSVLSLLG